MQQIIKQEGSDGQFFEAVNFAFIKIAEFLVKRAIFWHFCFCKGCPFTKRWNVRKIYHLIFEIFLIFNSPYIPVIAFVEFSDIEHSLSWNHSESIQILSGYFDQMDSAVPLTLWGQYDKGIFTIPKQEAIHTFGTEVNS